MTITAHSAGIGKSSFGLYVLWRLVKEGRSVLYEYPRGIDGGHELRFGAEPFDAFIADGVTARYSSAPTFLISGTSSDKAIIYDFLKRPFVKNLYMRKPTMPELHLLREKCFPAVTAASVSEIARRWGPRPRQVLAQQSIERGDLEDAITETEISALAKLARTMSERVAVNDVSFRIVDYVISKDCSHVTYDWASPYIKRRVMERVMAASERDRLSLLQDMLSTDGGLQMVAPLWEDWCDIVMREGSGDKGFRIRQLGVGSLGRKPQAPQATELATLLRTSTKSLGVQEIGGEQRLVVPLRGK